jgi:hypothetical protein
LNNYDALLVAANTKTGTNEDRQEAAAAGDDADSGNANDPTLKHQRKNSEGGTGDSVQPEALA